MNWFLVTNRRRASALSLLASVCLVLVGCDRALMDPALRDGDEAALLRAAGLARPEARYTLAGLAVEAGKVLGRSEGGAAARDLLAEFTREQAALLGGTGAVDEGAAAAARDSLRRAQLTLVAGALGKDGAARALAGLTESVARAGEALDAAGARRPHDLRELRWQQSEITLGLRAARDLLDRDSVMAALDVATRAADQLLVFRRGVLDLDRVVGLPELYQRAERILARSDGAIEGAADLLAEHARLKEAARVAVASGDRDRAHAALTAVRESELRIALAVLGPGTAAQTVAGVDTALSELRPTAPDAEPRLRRMLQAAADLQFRASSALRRGDGAAAVDLASYAAGLLNAYRLGTARF